LVRASVGRVAPSFSPSHGRPVNRVSRRDHSRLLSEALVVSQNGADDRGFILIEEEGPLLPGEELAAMHRF
jgi:hypothetical protein